MQVIVDHSTRVAFFKMGFVLCLLDLMAPLSALSGYLSGAYPDWFDARENLTSLATSCHTKSSERCLQAPVSNLREIPHICMLHVVARDPAGF